MVHPSVETFDLEGAFPQTVRLGRRGIRSPIDAGMLQHRQTLSSVMPSGQAAVRRFALTFPHATLAEYHRAVELWADSAGGCEPIDLTIRGVEMSGGTDETIQVRMLGGPMALASVGPTIYSFTLDLEEFGHAP